MILKINFCDFYKEFNKEDNYFTRIIEKYYEGYEISGRPDFLFYSCYGTEHLKYKNCVKIFYTGEPVSPDFNECDYAIGYDWISFEDRYYRRPLWLTESDYSLDDLNTSSEYALKRRFCNFIYSNSGYGEGAELRKKVALSLSKYKHVDCPGKVLNNMKSEIANREDADWRKSKVEFISKYKFTIAFENTAVVGYSTEKLLHPLLAKSVPIYWGDPKVEREFDKNSFVYCNEYDGDVDKIVERIIELDNNDEEYLKMIYSNRILNRNVNQEMIDFEQWIVHIINKGNNPYNKDPISFANRMNIRNMSRKEKILYFFHK